MRKQFPFEKLEVWQSVRKLVADIYDCSRTFQAYDLSVRIHNLRESQLRRAEGL